MTMTTTTNNTRRRGFASMSPERLREIASKGGHARAARGVGHRWTSEEARLAGRQGGRGKGRRKAVEMHPLGED